MYFTDFVFCATFVVLPGPGAEKFDAAVGVGEIRDQKSKHPGFTRTGKSGYFFSLKLASYHQKSCKKCMYSGVFWHILKI